MSYFRILFLTTTAGFTGYFYAALADSWQNKCTKVNSRTLPWHAKDNLWCGDTYVKNTKFTISNTRFCNLPLKYLVKAECCPLPRETSTSRASKSLSLKTSLKSGSDSATLKEQRRREQQEDRARKRDKTRSSRRMIESELTDDDKECAEVDVRAEKKVELIDEDEKRIQVNIDTEKNDEKKTEKRKKQQRKQKEQERSKRRDELRSSRRVIETEELTDEEEEPVQTETDTEKKDEDECAEIHLDTEKKEKEKTEKRKKQQRKKQQQDRSKKRDELRSSRRVIETEELTDEEDEPVQEIDTEKKDEEECAEIHLDTEKKEKEKTEKRKKQQRKQKEQERSKRRDELRSSRRVIETEQLTDEEEEPVRTEIDTEKKDEDERVQMHFDTEKTDEQETETRKEPKRKYKQRKQQQQDRSKKREELRSSRRMIETEQLTDEEEAELIEMNADAEIKDKQDDEQERAEKLQQKRKRESPSEQPEDDEDGIQTDNDTEKQDEHEVLNMPKRRRLDMTKPLQNMELTSKTPVKKVDIIYERLPNVLQSKYFDKPREESDASKTESEFELTREELVKMQLKRTNAELWFDKPFFHQTVIGCYVRVVAPDSDSQGARTYEIAEITNLERLDRCYPVRGIPTKLGLRIRARKVPRLVPIYFLNDEEFTQEEFETWKATVAKLERKFPNEFQILAKAKDIEFADRKQKNFKSYAHV